MAVKHFIIDPSRIEVDKKSIQKIEKIKTEKINKSAGNRETKNAAILKEQDTLVCVYGRVIVKCNKEGKNEHTFDNGVTIRRERQFNNLNVRETMPVNAIVISAENIPSNVEILVHPNSLHDSNKVFNYKNDTADIGYYSIKTEDCFFWKDEHNEWQPLKPYEKALRVFEPYKGMMEGVLPKLIKDTLFVTTGELKELVVKTLIASDYQVIFQDINGKEGNLIKFRPFGDPETNKEEEAIAILHDLTEQIKNGELLVGISVDDCKKLN